MVFPYKIEGDIRPFQDCSQNKYIRCYVKLKPGGCLTAVIYNYDERPQHITSRMKLVMTQTDIDEIELINGEKIKLKSTTKIRINEITQKDDYVQIIRKKYADVFKQEPKNINQKLNDLRITENDCVWRTIPKNCWRANYQSELSSEEIRNTIKDLIKQKVIRVLERKEAIHAIVAPLNFIRKPNGNIRPTIDFRDINAYLKEKQRGAIKDVDTVLNEIDPDWKVYAVIDIVHGYGAIPLDPSLSRYFAIHYENITYGFIKVPQGVNVAPEWFNSRMTQILKDTVAVRYFDDILIGGRNNKELFKNLCEVLDQFQEYNLTINLEKSKLFEKAVNFIGVELYDGKLNPIKSLGKIMQSMPTISKYNDIQKAVGLCQRLAPYCWNYKKLTTQLNTFLKKNTKKSWTDANIIFKNTVSQITKNIYLRTLGTEGPLYLYTDWAGDNQHNFGYCLFNKVKEPCAFGSQTFPQYTSSFLGELAGIIYALKQVKGIIQNKKVYIYSDNKATVEWLENPNKLHKFKDLRIQRLYSWLIWHFPTNVKFRFIEGKDNRIADLLSRWKVHNPIESKICHMAPKEKINILNEEEVMTRKVRKIHENYNHCGVWPTIELAKAEDIKCTWKLAENVIKRCDICQRWEKKKKNEELGRIITKDISECIGIDFMGPLPKTPDGKRMILIIIDYLSRYVELYPMKNGSSKEVIESIEDWSEKHNKPQMIIADSDKKFKNGDVAGYCYKAKIKMKYVPINHHQSNGTVERVIASLQKRIGKVMMINKKNWLRTLEEIKNTYNQTPHSVTKFPPRMLRYGINIQGKALTESELKMTRERAYENTEKIRDKYKIRYDDKIKKQEFNVHDLVLIYNHVAKAQFLKLEPLWLGPFEVQEKLRKGQYMIKKIVNGRVKGVVLHADDIKLYRSPISSGSV